MFIVEIGVVFSCFVYSFLLLIKKYATLFIFYNFSAVNMFNGWTKFLFVGPKLSSNKVHFFSNCCYCTAYSNLIISINFLHLTFFLLSYFTLFVWTVVPKYWVEILEECSIQKKVTEIVAFPMWIRCCGVKSVLCLSFLHEYPNESQLKKQQSIFVPPPKLVKQISSTPQATIPCSSYLPLVPKPSSSSHKKKLTLGRDSPCKNIRCCLFFSIFNNTRSQ